VKSKVIFNSKPSWEFVAATGQILRP